MEITRNLFESYCYGPADLLSVSKGSSTMHLTLRDPAGVPFEVFYQGCVYWRLGEEQAGMHLSLVRHVSAAELLSDPDSETMRALRKNADDVPALLTDWEQSGLSFYLHLGTSPETEYLVAAKSLHLRELP